MACNHRPHHHQTPIPPSSCCSCCNSSSYQTQCPHPSSHPPCSDPLLQAMVSRVFYSSPAAHCAQDLKYHPQALQKPHRFGKQQRFNENDAQETQYSAVSMLLSRIDAMEASLHKLTYSSSYSSFRCSSGSLRHAAARTIQIHFRAFLVRRSRTLRDLKELALVKSSFSSIKSSLFNGTRYDYEALSLKIMDLLLVLDSIQGSNHMVRDSKRMISRGLIQFLDLIDGRREKLFSKTKRTSKSNQNICKSKLKGSKQGNWEKDHKDEIDNLRRRIEKVRGLYRICDDEEEEEDVELKGFNHGSDEENEDYRRNIVENDDQIRNMLAKRHGIKAQSKVKKGVRFTEDEKLSTHKNTINQPVPYESSLDESQSSDDHVQLVDNLCNDVEEIKVFSPEDEADDDDKARTEVNEFRNTDRNVDNGGNDKIRRQTKASIEEFLFSAPLPVKMEDKAELLKKRKVKLSF